MPLSPKSRFYRRFSRHSRFRVVIGLVGLAAVFAFFFFYMAKSPADPLTEILEGGELVVLTRNAPTIYFRDRNGHAGYEYELVCSFAEYLGLKPRFVEMNSTADILNAVKQGKGHIASAALTRTSERMQFYPFGPEYHRVRQQVVCRRGGPKPDSINDLLNVDLVVVGDSSYEERLRELQKEVPDLNWSVESDIETEYLLEAVWRGEVECTVADSNIVDINRRYFPELRPVLNLTEEQSLAWITSKEAMVLQPMMESWLAGFTADGRLGALREKYYGFVPIFDYVDLKRFQRRVVKRLPKYRSYFEKAADQHDFHWTLLAAQAYQESHWNPRAVSPTGVRGMMMLTRPTAEMLGVENRLDPEESIRGGSRYLRRVYDRLPEGIIEPDRTWMALAAYNVGFYHLKDARLLAERQGKNPDSWADLRGVLPLLSQRKYYKTLRYGYARGGEPVRYVQRIRDFQDQMVKVLNSRSQSPLAMD